MRFIRVEWPMKFCVFVFYPFSVLIPYSDHVILYRTIFTDPPGCIFIYLFIFFFWGGGEWV